MATKEYFPQIGKIKFEGKESKNPLAFRYYDPEKVINGKKMKDWHGGTPSAPKVATNSAAEQKSSRGTKVQQRWNVPKTKWTPVLKSCKR